MTKESLPSPKDLFPKCPRCGKDAEYETKGFLFYGPMFFACSYCLYSFNSRLAVGIYSMFDFEEDEVIY